MRVLVIDDDAAFREGLETALTRQGHQVSCARDGEDGLRMSSQCQPDAIVLDVLMPKLDGWETCRRLREQSDVPILFLSRLGSEEHIVRGLDCGGDDYLVKPHGLHELEARLTALARRARLRAAAEDPSSHYDDGVLSIDLKNSTACRRITC